ncbi:thioredoxin-like protein [Scleroderma citrinum]
MTLLRPRRILTLTLFASTCFAFYLFVSSSATSYLSTSAPDGVSLPNEVFGLLWFVTAPEEQGRGVFVHDEQGSVLGSAVNPEKPIDLAWYALGSIAAQGKGRGRVGDRQWKWSKGSRGGWTERMRVLREEYPLVVFSKSYCPYSARAKAILERYDLTPRPKIIEVDLRADAPQIKTLLLRLTHHSTFPNVILNGRSLGGSDDIVRMHEEGELGEMLLAGGLKVGWNGDDEGDIVV